MWYEREVNKIFNYKAGTNPNIVSLFDVITVLMDAHQEFNNKVKKYNKEIKKSNISNDYKMFFNNIDYLNETISFKNKDKYILLREDIKISSNLQDFFKTISYLKKMNSTCQLTNENIEKFNNRDKALVIVTNQTNINHNLFIELYEQKVLDLYNDILEYQNIFLLNGYFRVLDSNFVVYFDGFHQTVYVFKNNDFEEFQKNKKVNNFCVSFKIINSKQGIYNSTFSKKNIQDMLENNYDLFYKHIYMDIEEFPIWYQPKLTEIRQREIDDNLVLTKK